MNLSTRSFTVHRNDFVVVVINERRQTRVMQGNVKEDVKSR